MKGAVIADDLTGANDAGAQFACRGLDTRVLTIWRESIEEEPEGTEILVVNTESRHVEADEAARRVTAAVAYAAKRGAKFVYKKTDSTLRGNLGAELEAVCRTRDAGPLIYVPAVPSAGRAVRDGVLYVNGVPAAETEFGKDPLAPYTGSSVKDRIEEQSQLPMRIIPLHVLRAGQAVFGDKPEIVVVEGEIEADLERTARSARRGMPTCWAGPAAFAAYLPKLFGIARRSEGLPEMHGPILAACGSQTSVAVEQTERAVRAGFRKIPIDFHEVSREQGARSIAERVAADFRCGRDAVLTLTAGPDDAPAQLIRRFAIIVRDIMDASAVHTLVIFGGDTSQGILRELGGPVCRIRGEIELGVTCMEMEYRRQPITVITKSGGFGNPDILLTIRKMACK